MCGIGGIILSASSDQQTRKNASDGIELLAQRLEHRGPDAQHTYSNDSKHVHLAHTRLAIIELSDAASQPMHSGCGRYSLVFNGEIYNHLALRNDLKVAGHDISGSGDTALLLQWLINFGKTRLSELRGMFAFFFWDSVTCSGLAARDGFGIKPFYYSHSAKQKRFCFSSEVQALQPILAADNEGLLEASPDGINGYLRLGSLQEPNTLLDNVFALPAGHCLTLQDSEVQLERFWKPNELNPSSQPTKITSRKAAVTHLREALIDTIEAHFVSDVPVGLFLSGGVDSTALLALATEYYREKGIDQSIHTFSIAFEDPSWDEGHIAKRTAEHFGAHHTEWRMSQQEAQALFNDYLAAVDQPSIDGFNTYCVSKLASDAAYKVVLSGVGGDELFAGYASFKSVPRLRLLARLLAPLWPLTALLDAIIWRHCTAKLRRVFDLLTQPLSHSAPYFAFRGIFSRRETGSIMKALNIAKPSSTLPKSAGAILNSYELEFYMRNQLLRDADAMSMAWGLELRVPLVDTHFYQSISQIPKKWRLEQGKTLLIDAVPELPAWVVERPKQGFRFPFNEWLGKDWSELDKDFAWPEHIAQTPWYRRWAVISLLNAMQKLGIAPAQHAGSSRE